VPSGAIAGGVSGPDDADWSGYVYGENGVVEGRYAAADYYIVAGIPTPRTDATFTAPATVTLGDAVTVSGLPDPCWLQVNGDRYQITGGTVTRTPAIAREYVLELIGAYRGTATVWVKQESESALDADPRWVALQNATPQQVEAWLTANVTTIASARQVLKILLLAVRKLGA
jgi:hypothetical protein